ncbi:hypothetical protein QE152_g7505 [Popillia japonica]|uniref:Uncharacterized protein n=1 Tax=Popillia japonica TaxID=7064 RepID=A0AAW1MFE7_POPJA
MEFKVEVNRLAKEDLLYSLKACGIPAQSTVEVMRRTLRQAMRLPATSCLVRPTYPFSYAEDSAAIAQKLANIQTMVDAFESTRASSEYAKISTALSFVYGRINNSQPSSTVEQQKRSGFLVSVMILVSELKQKAKDVARASRPQSTVLDVSALDQTDDISSVGSVSDEEMPPMNQMPNLTNSTPAHSFPKPVPVSSWGIKESNA